MSIYENLDHLAIAGEAGRDWMREYL